jgi:small subunit ribosomal protein S20
MPNIRSAIKKVRKDKRRTAINRRWKERYKEAVKKARRRPSAEALKTAQKILDKAAKRGVIKKGKASRLKSRLAKNLSDGRK